MKIATWNVNSLRVRLPQLAEWVKTARPDFLALQETKVIDADFPRADVEALGYQVVFAGQKTYNGVAILSHTPAADVVTDIAGFDSPERRILAATYGDLRIVDLYVPNGSEVGSDKYQFKLRWLEAVTGWLRDEIARHPKLVVLGDFNIAPDERDVPDPEAWKDSVLFSPPERAALQQILALGLSDGFRLHTQDGGHYSWWDYRMGAFRRNLGLRIDHILFTPVLAKACTACTIDKTPRKQERPSDHAPVIAEIAFQA